MSFTDFIALNSSLTVEEYLQCGGFPFRVEELLRRKKIAQEFGRRKLDRNIALEFLYRLSQTQPHALSYTDSSLAFLANASGQGEKPKQESLAEQMVGVHLLRNFELRLFEGVSAPRQVFTWKSKSGNELDYLILNRSLKLAFPIEVKYQNKLAPADFISMEKSFRKGKIVGKTEGVSRELTSSVSLHHFLCSDAKGILG